MNKMPKGSTTILVRATMEAKKRLHEMAAEDGVTGAVLLHRLVMAEWKRRQDMTRYQVVYNHGMNGWWRYDIRDTQTGETVRQGVRDDAQPESVYAAERVANETAQRMNEDAQPAPDAHLEMEYEERFELQDA